MAVAHRPVSRSFTGLLIVCWLITPHARAGWQIDFDGSGSNPVLDVGVLYVGSADGALYALDPTSGRTIWRFQTGTDLRSGPEIIRMPREAGLAEQVQAGAVAAGRAVATGVRRIDMTPTIANGVVYVGSGDRQLYALDAATGRPRWVVPAGPGMASSNNTPYAIAAPLVRDGVVYFVDDDGLHALDASTGAKRWHFETLTEVPEPQRMKRAPSAPVLRDDTLYLTAYPFRGAGAPNVGYVYAVATASGVPHWVAAVDGHVSEPVVTEALVFVSSGPTLHALERATGAARWQLTEGRYGRTSHIAETDRIHFAVGERVVSVQQESGEVLHRQVNEPLQADLVADGQHLYVLTAPESGLMPATTLRAISLVTGQQAWSQRVAGYSDHVIARDGVVHVGGSEQHFAINSSDGKVLWRFKGAGPLSPPAFSDGMLFVHTPTVEYVGAKRAKRGQLYALDAATGKR